PLTDVQIASLRDANPGKDLKLKGSPAEELQLVYEKRIEPKLIDPTFVTHVPSVVIPLAKENKEDAFFADVYELAINGVEISPGYTELNDPDVQAKHFSHQVGDKEEQQKVDEDFLTALRYGMPPAGGMGMGVDRVLMMLTGAETIRDVILFPLMKPTAPRKTMFFSPANQSVLFWETPADELSSLLSTQVGIVQDWEKADESITNLFNHRFGS